jgi:hypothetical protein
VRCASELWPCVPPDVAAQRLTRGRASVNRWFSKMPIDAGCLTHGLQYLGLLGRDCSKCLGTGRHKEFESGSEPPSQNYFYRNTAEHKAEVYVLAPGQYLK